MKYLKDERNVPVLPEVNVASTWYDFNASSELTFLGRDSQIKLDHS